MYENRLIYAEQSIDSQIGQINSIKAAKLNLSNYTSRIHKNVLDFYQLIEQQKIWINNIKDNIEDDLNILRSIELDKNLQDNNRTTLLDCVNEGETRKWLSICQNEYETLAKKAENIVQISTTIINNNNNALYLKEDTASATITATTSTNSSSSSSSSSSSYIINTYYYYYYYSLLMMIILLLLLNHYIYIQIINYH